MERELPFEEGRPWSPPAPDPFVAEFKGHLLRAEELEQKIAEIEVGAEQLAADTKGSLAPLEKQQIVACIEAWKLVVESHVPASMMDKYALEAGVKAHGNEKIPCSRLMRAIINAGVAKGTKTGQRKRARASSYASAIDYAIRQNMTEDEFIAELDSPRKRASRHRASGCRRPKSQTDHQRQTLQRPGR